MLIRALRKQVSALEFDLRERSEIVERFREKLRREYEQATAASRTATGFTAWRNERLTQIAVAWVLGTVFVRFCEDNGFIGAPFLAGPGERLAGAEQRHEEYLRGGSGRSNRDWLVEAFDHVAGSHEALSGIFDRSHNPLWELLPSFEAATDLLRFWRQRDDTGKIRFDFTDTENLDTGFLGDLYLDLSDSMRKEYAPVQTPEFIVEFILDLTLEPAVAEFGLSPSNEVRSHGEKLRTARGLRCIDPACGSGTFLIGMFQRLLEKWREAEPGVPDQTLVRRALESVHGCDKNPSAVSIARFRLLVAAVGASGERRADRLSGFRINVAVGDSLLHGRDALKASGDLRAAAGTFSYETEDVDEFSERCDLLGRGSYHVALGNPPFIMARDRQEIQNYRNAYPSSAPSRPLSVLFSERSFDLTMRARGSAQAGGFVGLLTADSFTKRDFGRALIEDFFPTVGLTHVIDTSGAYIPGHGTPTVILVGRNREGSRRDTVRAVLGIQAEPRVPDSPAQGMVWRAIVEQVDRPGTRSAWVSSGDVDRSSFVTFPWNLAGGGEPELHALIDGAPRRLGELIDLPVGVAGSPGQLDVFVLGRAWFGRHPDAVRLRRELVVGDAVRDWHEHSDTDALVPYDADNSLVPFEAASSWGRHLWTVRQTLKATRGVKGTTRAESGEPWWAWERWVPGRYRTPMSLTFASVATHNHFALDQGGKAFHRSAPVITLPPGTGEAEHLALLGVLNSSTVCFWLKQVSPSRGTGRNGTGSAGILQDDDWAKLYSFTGGNLEQCPIPDRLPLRISTSLHAAAQRLAAYEPADLFTANVPPSRSALDSARTHRTELRRRMIAMQEESDWEVYGCYGLLSVEDVSRLTVGSDTALPQVELGERAFEIVLARRAAVREAGTTWFTRHGSTPLTEIPAHWPAEYRAVVQARIDTIESRQDIALIERPEHKRRWAPEHQEAKEQEAVRTWLLDRCATGTLWFHRRDGRILPRVLTVDQLATALGGDAELRSVAALYAAAHMTDSAAPLTAVLEEILEPEQVPYVSAMRYQESGLRKRAQWEQVWDLQRKEDETGQALGIPVPPRYTAFDFLRPSYWALRGKLDIPKERFISYPDAGSAEGRTLLLGWAGWDHRDQARALVDLIDAQEPWTTERVAPLLAGLQELMRQVPEWDAVPGSSRETDSADALRGYLDARRADLGLGATDVAAWRPSKKKPPRGTGPGVGRPTA